MRDLFPFGRDSGDDSLYAGTDGDAEDVSSAEIPLATNVRFFGRDYGSIFVSVSVIRLSVAKYAVFTCAEADRSSRRKLFLPSSQIFPKKA